MHRSLGPRSALVLTAPLLVLFFTLVAAILGPNLVERRAENVLWYALHIGGGTLVLLLGPFQFVASIRNRFRRYHRAAGYIYVVGSAMAVAGYFGMPKSELFLASQLVALSFWGASVVFAVLAIRSRKILAHQHNMARSFVLACYFHY